MDKTVELKSTLTGQDFTEPAGDDEGLYKAMIDAESFVRVTDGIAVLSDFGRNKCHTFSGHFGQTVFSLPQYSLDENTPFEDMIFNGIVKEDLLNRHILELRFFRFMQTIPMCQRENYQMSCILRFVNTAGKMLPVLHSSRYIRWHNNGAVWLALCTYQPVPIIDITGEHGIINSSTGEIIEEKIYSSIDNKILSRRQTEILSLLAKGDGSKQIAHKLNISVHTVNRHRQDILAALKVNNSSSAVEIAMRLRLI